MRWTSIALGAMGLAVLDAVVSKNSKGVGSWLSSAGRAINWFLSPAVAAFKTQPSTKATTTSATAANTASPATSSTASTTSAATLYNSTAGVTLPGLS